MSRAMKRRLEKKRGLFSFSPSSSSSLAWISSFGMLSSAPASSAENQLNSTNAE